MTPLRRIVSATVARAAQGYLGGRDPAGALETCGRLSAKGVDGFTLGFWNATGEDPERLAAHYLETADALANAPFDARISIKTPAFGFRGEIVRRLREHAPSRIALHLDAHGIDAQSRTLDLGIATGSGVTLPSRWRRSEEDARRIGDAGLEVRVVKGQFPAAPHEETDPAAGYLAVIDALAGRATRVFVASHDAPLARRALVRLLDAGTPCELELLYGLPPGPALAVAAELCVPCRVYVPFGMAYLPYALSGARRNPRILAWLLRDLLLGRRGWPGLTRARPKRNAVEASG